MVHRPSTAKSQWNFRLIDLITRIHRTGRGSSFRLKLMDGAAELNAEGELRTWDVATTAYQSLRYTSRLVRLGCASMLVAASAVTVCSIEIHSRQMRNESSLKVEAFDALRSAPRPIVTYNSTQQQMSCIELHKAQTPFAQVGVMSTGSPSQPLSVRMFCIPSNFHVFSHA